MIVDNQKEQTQADELIVHEKRLGPGYRFAVRAITFFIFGAFMLFAGATWVKLEVSENTTEVLKLDSVVESEIRKQNEILLEEGKEWLKHNRAYVDGKPTPEWLQYLERQRAIARARSNRTTFTEKSTYLWDRITRVWE